MVTAFIDELARYAIPHGRAAGVNPSLIIAQGILESAAGTSELALNSNNLFGIKAGAGWTGEVYTKRTKEWSTAKGDFEIVADFRKYDSYEGAVVDLVSKYATGTGWEPHNRYFAVLGETDYVRATIAVHAAGYATDPNYPAKLQRVIEQHDLTRFDEFIYEATDDNNEGDESMVKVAFDAGHGKFTRGKRSPAGEREWYFNDAVVRAAIAELNKYENVSILRTDDPSGNTDVGLTARTNKANAWKADVFVSCHHNALTGIWGNHGGVETFYMQGNSATSTAAKLANKVNPKVVSAMGIGNRGVKTANFAILRQTNMPAILVEGGFMDSKIDILAMRNSSRLKAQGESIATALAEFYGLKRKAAPTPEPEPEVKPVSNPRLFRVRKSWADADSQKGAFAEIEGAKELAEKNAGYKVFDYAGKLVYDPHAAAKPAATGELFRVRKSWADEDSQKGAFAELDGAKEAAEANAGYKVYDHDGKFVYDPRLPNYPIAPSDRLGEVRLKRAAAYLTKPAKDADVYRTLAAGHTCHVYEYDGEYVRLGNGWVHNPNGEVVEVVADYTKKGIDEEFAEAVERELTDGTRPDEPATRKEVAVMVLRALKSLEGK